MNGIDLIGYVTVGIGIATFCMRAMSPLRWVAIASSVVFIGYGAVSGVLPMLLLHGLLLPLNAFRVYQTRQLLQKVRETSHCGLRLDLLVPAMDRVVVRRGRILFQKGDRAGIVYYIVSGKVRLCDHGAILGAGQFLGEMAMFSPNGKRSDTAICDSEVELAAIREDTIWKLLYENPEFGLYLVRLIVERAVLRPPQAANRIAA